MRYLYGLFNEGRLMTDQQAWSYAEFRSIFYAVLCDIGDGRVEPPSPVDWILVLRAEVLLRSGDATKAEAPH